MRPQFQRPNLHHQHVQWYSSNQVNSVCWILDEAEAAWSPAAGTAGQNARCGMSDADADPCSCKCCSLWVWARSVARRTEWVKFSGYSRDDHLPVSPSLSPSAFPFSSVAQADSSCYPKRSSGQNLNFASSPCRYSDQKFFLIWLYCLHVTFMSRDRCLLEISPISWRNIKNSHCNSLVNSQLSPSLKYHLRLQK